MRVDIDGTHHDFLFFRDNARNVVDDAEVVVAHNFDGDAILSCTLSAPSGFHNAVAKAFAQFGGVRTIGAMYLYSAAHRNETENWIAIYGLAAFGQRVVYSF